jgi:hypothetical protein
MFVRNSLLYRMLRGTAGIGLLIIAPVAWVANTGSECGRPEAGTLSGSSAIISSFDTAANRRKVSMPGTDPSGSSDAAAFTDITATILTASASSASLAVAADIPSPAAPGTPIYTNISFQTAAAAWRASLGLTKPT